MSLTYEETLQRYLKTKQQLLSKDQRAAQFIPFAALTGFDEAIDQASKTLSKRKTMDAEYLEQFNQQISQLVPGSFVRINHFVTIHEDLGMYIEETYMIKGIYFVEQYFVVDQQQKIYFKDIVQIHLIKK